MVRKLALLAVAIFALAAGPAHAAITLTNVQTTAKDPKAGANSDFTLVFELPDSEPIKDLDVNLPAGLLGNPNNPAKCTDADFQSDACSDASKVGTQTVDATVGVTPATLNGTVYNLVPDAGEPALLGIKLDPPAGLPLIPTTHLKSHVRVRSESDSGLTSTLRDIPKDSNGISVKINKITLTLNGDVSGQKHFMRNPTSCDAALTRLHAVGYNGGTADGQGSFTPTDCAALPFSPTLTATVGATGLTAARSVPPLSTTIEQAPGEAGTKSARVTLLSPLGPNVGALANVCSVDDYNADKCPDTSKVGAATAITPLLPTPLTGPVRIVDVPGSLPKLVVYLNGLINLRLTGNIQLAALGTETTFAGIPDVPLSRFKLDFFSGPNGLVGTTGDICKSGVGIKGEFTAHSGKTVTVTSPASVEGCPAGVLPPGNARPLASVALRRLAGKSPLLSVSAKQRASGQPLRSVDVFLPSGLSFDRGTLSAGVKATKGVTASLRGKGVLQLRSTVPAARIGAVVKGGALRVSAGLRRRLGKSPKLTVVLRATDAGGKAYTLKKRVTARR